MRRSSLGVARVIGFGTAVLLASVAACGTDATGSFGGDGGADSALGSGGGSGSHSSGVTLGGAGSSAGMLGGATSSGGGGTATSQGGTACPAGLTCDVSCPSGKSTTVSGRVYDPAGKNPLYGVAVYVPATALAPLPKGVPTGADQCSCGALYASGAITNATTDVNGNFTLTNVPLGAKVPLVLQIGKWRRSLTINVATSCGDNPQTGTSLTLPGTVAAGDTDDNMPDIAVSTGSADTLECLLLRIGVSASEYVPGTSTAGHVHVFSGGSTGGGGGGGFGGGGGGQVGRAESKPMANAPVSSTSLWDTQAHLMPFDVVLLSCEGGETYDANPPALESYLNVGGRAFASHFHYAWFSGPLGSTQSYSAPSDWGSNLATWSADKNGGGGGGGGGGQNGDIGGVIDLTLNGSTKPFSKGATLDTWLDARSALGGGGVASTELSIYQPKYNATVTAANKVSQPWITADSKASVPNATMYFSFDTPVNAATPADGGSPAYCGRAVFSDLHVAGNPATTDDTSKAPPASCANVNLSPQEMALEFMLFDLSSCVVPDTVAVMPDAGLPPPPSK